MKRATALAITLIVLVSMVAMPLGVAVGTASAQSSGPSGMVALGPDQVSEDLPSDSTAPIRASDLEGAVYASDHADTLEIIVTTPERADQYLGENANVVADDDVAIVLRDDEVHEGRDVAVDVDVLEAGVGYVPSVAYGTHSSGEEWQSAITRDGTVASWHIPKFSSNTVTFTGGIELTGDAAGDGTNYQYELGSLDGVDNYAINVTGVENTKTNTKTGVSTDSDSPTVSVGGSYPAEGTLSVTGYRETQSDSWSVNSEVSQKTWSNPPQYIQWVNFTVTDQESNGYLTNNDYTISVDGSTVSSGSVRVDDGSSGSKQVNIGPVSPDSEVSLSVSTGNDEYVTAASISTGSPDSVSATIDGTTHNFGSFSNGESKTQTVNLSPGDKTLSWAGGGIYKYNLTYTEATPTTDPVVEVNGYETEYNGVLSEGETTSLATNEAWLEEGTNNVTVSTNSPSTGPESLVDLEYAHDAAGTTREVDVEATSWTESFNISHTYPSETLDASATLTFDEQVAEIDSVEYRVAGGSWQEPPSYDLNGTDLQVGFGDVPADTDIDVRATGHKVRAYDGDVKVTEPTVEGDDLATEVEVTDINPDGRFGLRVDETVLGDRLHYASEESWSGDSAHAELTSSGTQILRADDANVGSTMTVGTLPISATPENGAIEAQVEDASTPTISLRKGDTTGASRVGVTYYDTIPGNRYVLWSETSEQEVDADRAESPVDFVTDGSSETYSILQRDEGAGSDGTAVGGPIETQDTLPLVLVFGGVAGVLVVTTLLSRRFGIGGWLLPAAAASLTLIAIHVLAPTSPVTRIVELAAGSNAVTVAAVGALLVGMWQLDERTSGSVPWYIRGVVGLLSVIWALETLSPGVILGGLRSGFESMGPLIVIVIVGGGWYLIREWIQARQAPDTTIEANIMERE